MRSSRLPAVGSPVVVAATLYREKDGNQRRWLRDVDSVPDGEPFPVRRGIVTGYSHRCDGEFSPASGGGYGYCGEEYEYEPAYLAVTKKHLVILVRFWAWGPEFCALPADVTPAPADGWSLPSTRGEQTWESAGGVQARAFLREEMSKWPRDEKGRWKPSAPSQRVRGQTGTESPGVPSGR